MSDYNVNVTIKLTDNITSQLSKLNKTLDKTQKRFNKLDEITKTAAGTIQKFNAEVQKTESALTGANSALQNATNTTKDMKAATDTAKDSAEKLAEKEKKVAEETEKTKSKFDTFKEVIKKVFEVGHSLVDKFKNKIKEIGTQIQDLNGAMQNLKTKIQNVFNTGLLAPFYNYLKSIFNLANAINFGKATLKYSNAVEDDITNMKILSKNIYDAEGKEIKSYGFRDMSESDQKNYIKEIREITHQFGTNLDQGIQSLNKMFLAGYDAKGAKENLDLFLEMETKMNFQSGISYDRASDLLTDAAADFFGDGPEARDRTNLTSFFDTLSYAQVKYNQSTEQLLEGYTKAGSTFKAAGLDQYQATNLLGYESGSRKGNEAGNALSAMLARLTAGAGSEGDPVWDALNEMGVKVHWTNDGKIANFDKLMSDIVKGIEKLDPERQSAVMKELFGINRYKDAANMLDKFKINPLTGRSQFMEDNIDLATNSKGESTAQMEQIRNSFTYKMRDLKNLFKDQLMLPLGDGFKKGFEKGFKPALDGITKTLNADGFYEKMEALGEKVGEKVGDAFSWIWEHRDEIWDVVVAIGKLAILFEGLQTVSSIIGVFQGLGTVFTVITSSPILTTLTILGGVIYNLWQYSDEFREACGRAWDTMKNTFTKCWEKIKDPLKNLVKQWERLWKALGPIAGWIIEIAAAFLEKFLPLFTEHALTPLVQGLAGAFENLSKFLEAIWKCMKGDWAGAWASMKSIFTDMANWFTNTWAGKIVSKVMDFSSNLFSGRNTGDAMQNGTHAGGNAKGTDDWEGGLTYVNEGYKGELISLPSGTRIIPNDLSKRIIDRNAQNKQSKGMYTNISMGSVVIREEADIDKIGREITLRLERYRENMI